jgi:hypothetical protein
VTCGEKPRIVPGSPENPRSEVVRCLLTPPLQRRWCLLHTAPKFSGSRVRRAHCAFTPFAAAAGFGVSPGKATLKAISIGALDQRHSAFMQLREDFWIKREIFCVAEGDFETGPSEARNPHLLCYPYPPAGWMVGAIRHALP